MFLDFFPKLPQRFFTFSIIPEYNVAYHLNQMGSVRIFGRGLVRGVIENWQSLSILTKGIFHQVVVVCRKHQDEN